MFPRDDMGHSERRVACRSMLIAVESNIKAGIETDFGAMVAWELKWCIDAAVTHEKGSKKAKEAQEDVKAWCETFCGLLDAEEADGEPQVAQQGASQKEDDMAHGATTAGEKA